MDRPVRVACVQAEPVIFDRDATIEKLAGLAAQAAGNGAQLLVLESEQEEYLGHLWLTETRDASGKRILEVTTMGIVRGARGEGLGRLLMQKAETEARERGIGDIELSVAGNNRRARDLYRDLGYETVRRTMRKRLRP